MAHIRESGENYLELILDISREQSRCVRSISRGVWACHAHPVSKALQCTARCRHGGTCILRQSRFDRSRKKTRSRNTLPA